ncbi:hypothetical protein CRUP_030003 [Coryphaenoides rupestris]|nr:hypothetical protein CRUP_030003 [Coryphaenoides rupestris]
MAVDVVVVLVVLVDVVVVVDVMVVVVLVMLVDVMAVDVVVVLVDVVVVVVEVVVVVVVVVGVRFDSTGVILSPGFPDSYPNLQMCSWLINVEKGYNITLHFELFQTEKEFDILEIFDGPNIYSQSLASLSGDVATPFNLTTTGHQLLLRWSSDHGTNRRGFHIRYVDMANEFPGEEQEDEEEEEEEEEVHCCGCGSGFTLVGSEILTCRLGERLQMDGPPPLCQANQWRSGCGERRASSGARSPRCIT